MRAFEFALNQLWAIKAERGEDGHWTSPDLDLILRIAQRAHEPDWEAVAMKQAKRMDDYEVLQMRGEVAVLNVAGPIFRYANLFTEYSGASSIQMMAQQFQRAVDDPATRAIVLNIDSPGGAVAGLSEFAQAIYDARQKKPIVAYADGLAASAAYWIASAAGRIVASETAELGSIGVMAKIMERPEPNGVKSYTVISSMSPRKNRSAATDEGRADIQQRIDDLGSVFVANLARNRNVTENAVLADFGQGAVMIASKAIAAGMADEIGTFEGLISSLEAEIRSGSRGSLIVGGSAANPMKGAGVSMENPNNTADQKPASQNPPVDVEAIKASAFASGKTAGIAEGRTAERTRIGAIIGCEEAKGREDLARTIALETETEPTAAAKLLQASPKVAPAAPVNPLAAAMEKVPNPKVGQDGAEANEESTEAMIRRISGIGAKGGN